MDDFIDDVFPDSSIVSATAPTANTIRETIVDKVNSVLWLDSLNAEDEAYATRLKQSRSTTEKCMVCTLPYGTCIHTRQWVEETYKARTDLFDPTLDQSIDDMLNVMGEFKIETAPVLDDIDLNEMMWKPLEERLTDRIGSTNVCLFAPDERGWHSTVRMGEHLVFVFGGFKYR